MSGAPWWVTAAVGLVTALVTIAGVVLGSGRQLKGLREQIDADGEATRGTLRGGDRSEWFRRVQWAHGLLQRDETQIPGFDVLRVLAAQADDADAHLIKALVASSSRAEHAAARARDRLPRNPATGNAVDAHAALTDTGGGTSKGQAHD